MKKLYLAFSSGDGLWDRVIKFVEKNLEHPTEAPRPLASHAYLIFGNEGRWTGIEASPPIIRMWDIPTDPRVWDRRYIVPMTDTEFDVAFQYALDQVGKGYRYLGQLIAGLYCLTRIPMFRPSRIRFICSELCVNVLRNSNVIVLADIPS